MNKLIISGFLSMGTLAVFAGAGDVESYIRTNLPRTVVTTAVDDGPIMALPRPYSMPGLPGVFREMYYWDTYFTNLGFLRIGDLEQAVNNTEDIAYMIDWLGFMPNGNRTSYLPASQPPFFTKTVDDVYARTGDKAWLARMYPIACREHRFWQEKRMSPSGLNRYAGLFATDAQRQRTAKYFCERIGVPVPTDKATIARRADALKVYGESGWDCTSRFNLDPQDSNWVCHNALLFGMEEDLAHFAKILGTGEEAKWRACADRRRELMNALMWDGKLGMFCDYNFVTRTRSDFVSVAAFYPLYVGLATPEQAARTRELLAKLEFEHGLASSENRNLQGLQWDYPHGWAPLHYIAISGLVRYGYAADAKRLAAKYCTTLETAFAKTGELWEKYDVTTGEVSVCKEYKTPTMLGWTAGVYLWCKELLK